MPVSTSPTPVPSRRSVHEIDVSFVFRCKVAVRSAIFFESTTTPPWKMSNLDEAQMQAILLKRREQQEKGAHVCAYVLGLTRNEQVCIHSEWDKDRSEDVQRWSVCCQRIKRHDGRLGSGAGGGWGRAVGGSA